jgi:hypothetical protein
MQRCTQHCDRGSVHPPSWKAGSSNSRCGPLRVVSHAAPDMPGRGKYPAALIMLKGSPVPKAAGFMVETISGLPHTRLSGLPGHPTRSVSRTRQCGGREHTRGI